MRIAPPRIGIDLGGTKIEGIALDSSGKTLIRKRKPTPVGDYGATLRAVTELTREIESALRLEAGRHASVGVGIPGTISPASGLVKNANSTWLNGRPFDRDLATALGRPVRVANDANCFALSEATDGAGAGATVVFGVILGTGVGGGVVVEGRPLIGANAIAGEWGHNPLPWPLPWPEADERPGPPCYCGRTGCIETFLSGPGLSRDFRLRSGRTAAAPEVAALADAGDTDALRSLELYEDRLARALATVINLLDPEIIVLGGGLSNLLRLYEAIPRRWTRYVFSDRVDTRLLPPAHGDSSGVRGAAWLWPADDAGRR